MFRFSFWRKRIVLVVWKTFTTFWFCHLNYTNQRASHKKPFIYKIFANALPTLLKVGWNMSQAFKHVESVMFCCTSIKPGQQNPNNCDDYNKICAQNRHTSVAKIFLFSQTIFVCLSFANCFSGRNFGAELALAYDSIHTKSILLGAFKSLFDAYIICIPVLLLQLFFYDSS